MRKNTARILGCAVIAAGLSVFAAELPKHQVPASKDGSLVVGLCDGETSVEVKDAKPGDALSHDQAQKTSQALMESWKKKHPGTGKDWDKEEKVAVSDAAPNANQGAKTAGPAAQKNIQGQTYGSFGERDKIIWDTSVNDFVAQGKAIFHDAKKLGGTVAISCDMCHPNAANTHPETYPKYQVQLGKVALLRDVINWCIENPVRGKPLADDDERLKAMEAYIYAQRKGTPLEYGKH